MPFGLKNAGATYQRAMNAIFHDMLGHHMKIYIDDIVVKSKKTTEHVNHLRKSFERMRLHQLKLNPFKCEFGVQAEDFLGTKEEWKLIKTKPRISFRLRLLKIRKNFRSSWVR